MRRFDRCSGYLLNQIARSDSARQRRAARESPARRENRSWPSAGLRAAKVLAITFAVLGDLPSALLAADAISNPGELPEIVVTAQKRVEDVQHVPISISVFDTASFDRLSIQDLSDVANLTPGVDYQAQGTKNNLAIRGIYSGTGAATTAIYIDDVPVQVRVGIVGLIGATLPKVFDLDRVEVLRGPQGTLFGSGAEGGAIRFITPEPSLTQYSGYSRADVGSTVDGDISYEAGAAFGGPIVANELGFRVSAWHRRDGGYIDHISAIPGGYDYANSNWDDSDVVRAALMLAPTQSLQITPSLYYQHSYSHDLSTFEPAQSSLTNDAFVQNLGPLNPRYSNIGQGQFVNPGLEQTPSTDTFYLPALKVVQDFAAMQVTSITAYLHRENTGNQDFTGATPAAFGLPWATVAVGADHNVINTYQNVLTEDLRLQSSDATSALQWTLGASYTEARQRSYNPESSPYLPTLLLNGLGMTIVQVTGVGLLPGGLSYIGDERSTDTQAAIYGQATYRIFKPLSVTAGARVARDTNKYSVFQTGPFNFGTTFVSGDHTENVKDPKVAINFEPNDNVLLYVSAAKGDRIGGVNAPFGAVGQCAALLAALGLNGVPPAYQGDSLWSYEIGSKNRLFGGHLQLQASAFHIDWSNVQQTVTLPACSESFTSNLGKAGSDGGDLQVVGLVGDSLELGLNVGYTSAKDKTTIMTGALQSVTKGDQLNPYSAPWSVDASAQYSFLLAYGYKAYLRVDDEFHSKNSGPFAAEHMANASFDPNFIANPATNELNAHFGTTWGGWDTSVYALNLLNTHPLLYNAQLESSQPQGAAYTFRPRTVGVRAIFRW
jgi:iron complex outermembrane receptor protein